MTRYHGPSMAESDRRVAMTRCALDDLSPESRAEIDARVTNLGRIHGVAEYTALEIVAALAMMCGEDDGDRDAAKPAGTGQ